MTLSDKLWIHRFEPQIVLRLLQENESNIPFIDKQLIYKFCFPDVPVESLKHLVTAQVPFDGTFADLENCLVRRQCKQHLDKLITH